MLAKLQTFSLVGIDALPVEVEVDVSPSGLPKTVLVGPPEAAGDDALAGVGGSRCVAVGACRHSARARRRRKLNVESLPLLAPGCLRWTGACSSVRRAVLAVILERARSPAG
jgi:hypothetical protein